MVKAVAAEAAVVCRSVWVGYRLSSCVRSVVLGRPLFVVRVLVRVTFVVQCN